MCIRDRDICPQAKLSLIENAGHFPHIGSPDEWRNAVMLFFDKPS